MNFRAKILSLLSLAIAFAAFAHSYAKAEERPDPFWNCYTGYARGLYAFERLEVRKLMDEKEGEIREAAKQGLERVLFKYPDKEPSVRIHEDILACRMCGSISHSILGLVRAKVPRVEWYTVRTGVLPEWQFGHIYVYSPKLNLIVDGSYRQFLVHLPPEEFARLPPVFVGSPEEFRTLVSGKMSKTGIDHYLSAGWDDEENPLLKGVDVPQQVRVGDGLGFPH